MRVEEVLGWLEKKGTKKQVGELARYGIEATRPFGVAVGELKKLAKELGKDHALAKALWESGRYEARMLAAMVDEAEKVTSKQMDDWARGFDNWALVDTACFHLFDRATPAWKKVGVWAKARGEFKKRAAFALIWSLTVHDKEAGDEAFLKCLPVIEAGATDERHFVKKAVNMALRAVGKRNKKLNGAALKVAKKLAEQEAATPRWIGRHALKELTSPKVQAKF